MIGIETKDRDIELKDDGYGTGSFSAYPATWDGPDRANEIIQRGAFADSLAEFVRSGWVTVNHKRELPVASIDSAVEDSRGLLVHATFHSTKEAQDVRTIARERASRGRAVPFSIGYHVLADEPIQMSGKRVRRLTRLAIRECSFVDMPCNDKAGLVSAKRILPELISVKELASWLESKEGRAISGENLSRLVAHRDELQDGVDLLSAFISVHDPEAGKPNPFQSIDDSISPGRTGGGAAVARAAKALLTWLDVATKVGKVLSAEHHAELSQAHKTLHSAVEGLGTFLAEHRPNLVAGGGSVAGAKGDNPFLEGFERLDDKQARLQELRRKSEAAYGRFLLAEDEALALVQKSKR